MCILLKLLVLQLLSLPQSCARLGVGILVRTSRRKPSKGLRGCLRHVTRRPLVRVSADLGVCSERRVDLTPIAVEVVPLANIRRVNSLVCLCHERLGRLVVAWIDH